MNMMWAQRDAGQRSAYDNGLIRRISGGICKNDAGRPLKLILLYSREEIEIRMGTRRPHVLTFIFFLSQAALIHIFKLSKLGMLALACPFDSYIYLQLWL
jgi:hypothetical protein